MTSDNINHNINFENLFVLHLKWHVNCLLFVLKLLQTESEQVYSLVTEISRTVLIKGKAVKTVAVHSV